jgi:hypothetical protein
MDYSLKVWKALTLIGIVCDEEIKDAVIRITAKGKGKTVRIGFVCSL